MRTRLDFPALLVARGLIGTGVEIGVLFGEFSAHLLEYWPGQLVLVDPWENQDPEQYLDGCNAVSMKRAYATALNAVAPYADRARILRKYSHDAAREFKRGGLSMVYLDGNHRFENVTQDIYDWWPLIQSGGILAGHDFYNREDAYQSCGVERAVRAFCGREGLDFQLTTDDEPKSWWIIKP